MGYKGGRVGLGINKWLLLIREYWDYYLDFYYGMEIFKKVLRLMKKEIDFHKYIRKNIFFDFIRSLWGDVEWFKMK